MSIDVLFHRYTWVLAQHGGISQSQEAQGVLVYVMPVANEGYIILVADGQARNPGATATNAISDIMTWTMTIMLEGRCDPSKVVWIELDSEGYFDRMTPTWPRMDIRKGILPPAVEWFPCGGRNVRAFIDMCRMLGANCTPALQLLKDCGINVTH